MIFTKLQRFLEEQFYRNIELQNRPKLKTNFRSIPASELMAQDNILEHRVGILYVNKEQIKKN